MTDQAVKRILCIEDELFISELYTRALRQAGYETIVAVDGNDGLERAQKDPFDIILLDLMLPHVTGMEILRTLRGGDNPVGGKILITTNLDVGEPERTELMKLADGYIIKADITPKQLVNLVESIL